MNLMLRTADKAPTSDAKAALISETLAGFAHDLAPAAIPAEVRERAAHLILDATGIALGLRPLRFRPQGGDGDLGPRRDGRGARDRPAAAVAAAGRGVAQRHPGARPRLRRHPHRRHHPRHGQHLADGAGDSPHARRVRRRPRHRLHRGRGNRDAARRRRQRAVPPDRLPPDRADRRVRLHAGGRHTDGALASRPDHGAGYRAVHGLGQPRVPGGRRLDQAHASRLGGAVGHHRRGAGAAGLRGTVTRLRGALRPVQCLHPSRHRGRPVGPRHGRAGARCGRRWPWR